ncbi:MAG: oxidoreductase [Pseudomonadota bacterium]
MTSERIAIVTGANNGIGFETAAGMAKAGFHVVMACRNRAKAESARRAIVERLPSASLDIMLVDLGDFASVHAFAQDFRATYPHLDVLINNAGILLYSEQTNGNCIELQFATNHLGHFLVTALLIDLMPDDPASRIVALSSIAHKRARIHFDDLTCGGDGGTAYGQSKLACLLFADELHRRLQDAGSKIKALAVHPGGSDSGLFDEMRPLQYYTLKALSPFITHSNASAAKPSLHAALAPDIAGGDYFGPTGILELRGPVGEAKRDPITRDLEVAKRLWSLSGELTGEDFDLTRLKTSGAAELAPLQQQT